MKKAVGLFITVIIMFCQALTAASENVIQYNPIMPECSFITTGDPIRTNMLMSTEYVSADEIWFSGTADEGGPWIVKTNAYGDILWQESFPILNKNDRITVRSMSKTPNGLLLGIIDNKTSKGYISLLSESGQFHQTSLGDAKIFSYTSSQLGMLAQGVLYDDATQTCAPQTTLIGVNGEIVFQKTGAPYEIAMDRGALTSSLCYASDNLIFVVEARSAPNEFPFVRELVCLDVSGNEMWRVTLESDMVVQTLSAANGNIYLHGFWGTWNKEGVLTNQQATIQCYSSEGVGCWTRKFDAPNIFQCADAKHGICVATGMEDDAWYIAVLNTEGQLQSAVRIESEAQYINKPYIISEKSMIILGTAGENLLIKKLEF